jgi:hypothetical protein
VFRWLRTYTDCTSVWKRVTTTQYVGSLVDVGYRNHGGLKQKRDLPTCKPRHDPTSESRNQVRGLSLRGPRKLARSTPVAG